MQTRAKFKCVSVKATEWSRTYEFLAVTSGSPENEEFFKTTPAGKLEIAVKESGALFQVGAEYYLDFTVIPKD